ncbi:hypothetical protein PPSIR1_40904 [Plesiocystis pacifica SIR-1]|uniref:VWFA domain-containing protein n=1 Tax=Plesiocystis pacifica SIR-1 TaxID=391625 RepID=A6GKG8_9BACT|nr:VWA domain-containing protein [Plesiocystis pacifica]EDM73632.1 hypothetical protein PPSIR1_40904 [Plesiocystis pacifica SIR-1]
MLLVGSAAACGDSGSDDRGDEAGEADGPGIGTESEDGSGDATDSTTTAEEDSGSTTAEEDESTTGPDCGTVEITPEYVPPNVMLVVDASGSMVNNSWDHDLDPNTPQVTRWNTLHGVVDNVMTNFGSTMYAGVQRFPSADACPDATPQSSNCYNLGSCIVGTQPEVGVGADNGDAILAAIPGPGAGNTEIVGGTPATLGINSAVDHLLAQNETNPRYILFITDGAANCNTDLPYPEYIESYDETLPTTVEAAFEDEGITTYVVGIDIVDMLQGAGTDGSPEANPFVRLNDVALAGGAPKNEGMDAEKFFNTTNQQELLDALQVILEGVTECVIDLTMLEGSPPPTEEQIPYVSFHDGEPPTDENAIPFVEDCENEDGWTWLEEGLIVTFCGSYCEDYKNGAEYEGIYGCPIAG